MELVVDVTLVAILGLVTYLVAQDGPWNAILTMFAVIFGGLLAMNFFEPLAAFVGKQIPSQETRADFLCLMGLFALFVFLIRTGLEQLAPSNLELPDLAYKIGQWGFGLLTGYITIAILQTSLHTAPLPRKFLGFNPSITPDNRPKPSFFGFCSPDVQWLGFTQHVTEHIFARRYLDKSNGQVAHRNFDGLRHVFPGKTTAEYLPTFIIRYATRRQQISGQAPAAAPIVVPTVRGQPTLGPGL